MKNAFQKKEEAGANDLTKMPRACKFVVTHGFQSKEKELTPNITNYAGLNGRKLNKPVLS
jgi:hypothetical protein